VPKSRIHQFGAGITNEDGRIVEWEEKPKVPRTNLASMGIYVFDTRYLLKLLDEDRQEVDFGMHLIPKAIKRDNVFAYPFHGYWRDVGTIQTYWEANMDILKDNPEISPQDWGIRPVSTCDNNFADRCPARFVTGSEVRGSMISAGSVIKGKVVNSVLAPGVKVKPGALVKDSIIIDDCIIEQGAVVDLAILDKRITVGKNAVVGRGDDKDVSNKLHPTHLYTGITLVGKEAVIPENAVIGRNCIIRPWATPDNFHSIHVESGETI
ncbi:MAG: glucose-1-phosphate adenylyltransferase, partial [Desulfobulbaceae bacterium]|nr:glucose-1-phosphate adenylyltransferase [Desulfobulbaceae bacterium]